MAESHRTVVAGMGNVLRGDDGVGIQVLRELEESGLDGNATLVDAGSNLFSQMDMIEGASKLVLVDAVCGGGEPGSVYRFTPDDVDAEEKTFVSVHEIGLLDELEMLRNLNKLPRDVVIIGVEPAEMGWSTGLSETVASRLPDIVDAVKREIRDDCQPPETSGCVAAEEVAQ